MRTLQSNRDVKKRRYRNIAASLYQVLLRTPEKHRGTGWLKSMQEFERRCFGFIFEEMR